MERDLAILTQANRDSLLEGDGLSSSTSSHVKNRITEGLERDIEIFAQHRPDLLEILFEVVIQTGVRENPELLEDILQDYRTEEERELEERVTQLELIVDEIISDLD